MNKSELAKWLERVTTKEPPWDEWFSCTYCHMCPPVVGRYENNKKEASFAWCELNDEVCKYFPELGRLNSEDIIKIWLNTEVEYDT